MAEKSLDEKEEEVADDMFLNNEQHFRRSEMDGGGDAGLLDSRLEAKLDPIRKEILAIRRGVSVILRKLDSR